MIYHLIAAVCMAHVTCWTGERDFTAANAKADCMTFGVAVRDRTRRAGGSLFFECKELAQ